ncbi:MAG: DUF5688 family protein [Lachnoclostridium sp.]|nr:DUF5688 family protein [Lachnospira sp.]MCM1247259.1 DUF5688 family protein [Lachnoclostridium sp.]MCM1536140.1 DUF5688 family protein [Clostridium sp.]
MMYEEFVWELYDNVVRQKESIGKKVRLIGPGMLCMDRESMRMAELIFPGCRKKGSNMCREDILCISWGRGISKMTYWKVRSLYECYLKEGWQSVLPIITVRLQKIKEESEEKSEKQNFWNGGYEQSRDRHILRPVNCSVGREELENCIYWKFGDIALVLYLLIHETPGDCMTVKLNRGMVENWGICDEVLLTNALVNTRIKMPPRLFHGDDIGVGRDKGNGIFMPEDGKISVEIHAEDEAECIRGYRLTTTRWLNGAVALFYPGVKERMAELFDSDYFVGFTSIHEAVIHPVHYKILGEMRAAIQHINAVFDEKDMLTNRIYRYCAVRRELIEV